MSRCRFASIKVPQYVFFFFFLIAWCIITPINDLLTLSDCLGGLRGSLCVRLSLFLSARTRGSTSVKRRRLAPPPLLFHNIRYKVTVCCGLRTLITRQENNVEGKAVQHHQRSLNPRGLSRPLKWLHSADQTPRLAEGYWTNQSKNRLHLTFPFQWIFLSFFLKFSSKRFQIRMSFFIIGSHSKSGR